MRCPSLHLGLNCPPSPHSFMPSLPPHTLEQPWTTWQHTYHPLLLGRLGQRGGPAPAHTGLCMSAFLFLVTTNHLMAFCHSCLLGSTWLIGPGLRFKIQALKKNLKLQQPPRYGPTYQHQLTHNILSHLKNKCVYHSTILIWS